ncbi:hypothetical protein MUK42_07226, partial [Musa troglodytarum]
MLDCNYELPDPLASNLLPRTATISLSQFIWNNHIHASLPILNTQPIQHACISLSRTTKERFFQLPESTRREQAVGTSLVADPDPLNIKQLGELVEPPMEAVAELHEMLDVVHGREVYPDEIEEASLGVGEVLASEHLKKVAEVITAVEGDPVDGVIKHDTRRHEELAEAVGVDPLVVVLLEVDAALAEELDGVGREDVQLHVEFAEVELPYAAAVGAAGGQVAELVGEGEAELDQLEHVDVGLEGGIVKVGAGPEASQGSAHDAGELRVHGDVGEVIHDLADQGKLRLQIDLDRTPRGDLGFEGSDQRTKKGSYSWDQRGGESASGDGEGGGNEGKTGEERNRDVRNSVASRVAGAPLAPVKRGTETAWRTLVGETRRVLSGAFAAHGSASRWVPTGVQGAHFVG